MDRFIHVSSYNADPSSASDFFASKAGVVSAVPCPSACLADFFAGQGRGEQVVRSIFPETSIVRPAPMFGFEDNLLLRLAGVYNLFTSNNMQERYWPVHVCAAQSSWARRRAHDRMRD